MVKPFPEKRKINAKQTQVPIRPSSKLRTSVEVLGNCEAKAVRSPRSLGAPAKQRSGSWFDGVREAAKRRSLLYWDLSKNRADRC